VFSSPSIKGASTAHKLVSCILATTGGGTLVPIFINAIPVSMAQDAYMIAIISSYILHDFFPILKDIVELSPYFKVGRFDFMCFHVLPYIVQKDNPSHFVLFFIM
jgi:hypothetical protein